MGLPPESESSVPLGLVWFATASAQVLEEFYEHLKNVGVSAATGEGIDAFFEQVQACAEEYRQLYLPELQQRQQVCQVLHCCRKSHSPWRCPGHKQPGRHCSIGM